jgi:nitrate reductase gamma subunit
MRRNFRPAIEDIYPAGLSPMSLSYWRYKLLMIRQTVLGTHPVTISVTLVFHLFLVVTPLFVLAHNIMMRFSWGVSLPSLSEPVADAFTLVVILSGGYFLCRRLFLRRVRSITTAADYLILLIVMAPFVTGYMAYHRFFDYQTVIVAHMLAGEIMLITIPFSKLVHMLFFFINRLVIVHENNLIGAGRRVWR